MINGLRPLTRKAEYATAFRPLPQAANRRGFAGSKQLRFERLWSSMARNESTTPALLGLLSIEPMSGYDMRTHLKDSMSYFWSESWGQIYPTLKRLTAEGLIRPFGAGGKGKRERQVYELTEQGRRYLQQWLALPPRVQQPRDEFLLKLFFGSSAPEGAIADHIRLYKAEQEKAHAMYRLFRDFVERERKNYPDQRYWLLMLSRGMAMRQADIGWCEQALAAIDENGGAPVGPDDGPVSRAGAS